MVRQLDAERSGVAEQERRETQAFRDSLGLRGVIVFYLMITVLVAALSIARSRS